MAHPLEDRDAANLTETREHFLLRQHILEELEILLEDVAGLVEDNQNQPGLTDLLIGFHLAQVFDDGAAPLGAVAAMAETDQAYFTDPAKMLR